MWVQAAALRSNDERWKWKHTHIHHKQTRPQKQIREDQRTLLLVQGAHGPSMAACGAESDHNTDLLKNNLFGQLVNSSLFHRAPHFMVAAFTCSQQARGMFDRKYGLNEFIFIFIHSELITAVNVHILGYRITENTSQALSHLFQFLCVCWLKTVNGTKSVGLFFSALLPGSSQIANSYLPPQARLNGLTVGLWLELRLVFHIQLTHSSNCRHMRAEAERKIWKRYILAKLRSKHRETVANIPKEGKKWRGFAHFYPPHK